MKRLFKRKTVKELMYVVTFINRDGERKTISVQANNRKNALKAMGYTYKDVEIIAICVKRI